MTIFCNFRLEKARSLLPDTDKRKRNLTHLNPHNFARKAEINIYWTANSKVIQSNGTVLYVS